MAKTLIKQPARFVNEHNSNWIKIGEAMQRSAESCRGRYQQYLVYVGTERKGTRISELRSRQGCESVQVVGPMKRGLDSLISLKF